jgi:subtilisin family serine protease
MKKFTPRSLVSLVIFCFCLLFFISYHYSNAKGGISDKNRPARAIPQQQPNIASNTCPVVVVHSSNQPSRLSSSLFSKLLTNNSQPAVSFLSYTAAPLETLSERESNDFPGARVIDFLESEGPCFKVRERLLDVSHSFEYPYIKTEELLDKKTGGLVARLEMVAAQFIVTLPEKTDPKQFLKQVGPAATSIERISQSKPIYRVSLSEASLESLPKALKKVEEISQQTIAGEPDYIAHATQRPSNYCYYYQWGLWKVNDFDFLQEPYQQLLNRYYYHFFNYFPYPVLGDRDFFDRSHDFEQQKSFNFLVKHSRMTREANLLGDSKDYFSSDRGINAEDAWETRTSADSVIVAVVDTGIRYTHENLKNNMWRNLNPEPELKDLYGKNFVDNNGDPKDDCGHGTHCAGIIGGEMNDDLGISGVAWKVQLMACKVLNKIGVGPVSQLIQGLDYAKQHHADIISCSWSYTEIEYISGHAKGLVKSYPSFETELSSLRESGIIVVAGANNNGKNLDNFLDTDPKGIYETKVMPASASLKFDNIVSVAATDFVDTKIDSYISLTIKNQESLASYSNFGAKSVSLAAPGSFILSTWNSSDTSYVFADGTSMATPCVAGALALMKAEFPTWTHQELITHLIATTDPLPSLKGKMRGGRLNLARALQPTLSTPIAPAAVTPPPPLPPLHLPPLHLPPAIPPPVIPPKTGMQDPSYWWY